MLFSGNSARSCLRRSLAKSMNEFIGRGMWASMTVLCAWCVGVGVVIAVCDFDVCDFDCVMFDAVLCVFAVIVMWCVCCALCSALHPHNTRSLNPTSSPSSPLQHTLHTNKLCHGIRPARAYNDRSLQTLSLSLQHLSLTHTHTERHNGEFSRFSRFSRSQLSLSLNLSQSPSLFSKQRALKKEKSHWQ